MTAEQIVDVLKSIERLLKHDHHAPIRYESSHPPVPFDLLNHCYWMAGEAQTFLPDHIGKANRWLGFIQGVLWAQNVCTIEELKDMNRFPHA